MTEHEMLVLLRDVEDHLRYDCGHCSGQESAWKTLENVREGIGKLTCHMTPDVMQKIEDIQAQAMTDRMQAIQVATAT